MRTPSTPLSIIIKSLLAATEVHTAASKRPLSTLLLQMAAASEAAGRPFDSAEVLRSFEHVCAVLLQALAPVMKVTYAPRSI